MAVELMEAHRQVDLQRTSPMPRQSSLSLGSRWMIYFTEMGRLFQLSYTNVSRPWICLV